MNTIHWPAARLRIDSKTGIVQPRRIKKCQVPGTG
jgi:hypothetical protein